MDMRTIVTVAALLIVALLFGGVFTAPGGTKDPADPALPWHSTLDEALLAAKQKHSLVLVDFYTDTCGWCKKMDRETFTDAGVRAKLDEFVLLKLDARKHIDVTRKYGVRGFPTTAILDENGKVLAMRPGFMPPKDYLAFLDEAKARK